MFNIKQNKNNNIFSLLKTPTLKRSSRLDYISKVSSEQKMDIYNLILNKLSTNAIFIPQVLIDKFIGLTKSE